MVLKVLVEHAHRRSMECGEGGMLRERLEPSPPLVPSRLVNPSFVVELESLLDDAVRDHEATHCGQFFGRGLFFGIGTGREQSREQAIVSRVSREDVLV